VLDENVVTKIESGTMLMNTEVGGKFGGILI
jgi:hypothetical protein